MTTLAVAVEIGAKLSRGARAAFDGTEAAARKVTAEIGRLDARTATIRGWTEQRSATRQAREAWTVAAQRARLLENAVAATETPTKALKRELAGAQKAASSARDTWRRQAETLRASAKAMRDAGIETRTLSRELAALERRSADLTRRRTALQVANDNRAAARERRAALRGQAVEAFGLAVALGAPIARAVRFEEAMADVRKVANWNRQETRAYGRELLDLSANKLPLTAAELAEIAAAAKQSGIATEELTPFVRIASKASVAWDEAAGVVGETFAGWRAGMGLTQERTVVLADAVNHLSNNMNATAPGIAQVISRQGALAQQAGLTETQIAALSAALLSSKQPPEIAGTALKNMVGALTSGEAATKRQRDALGALGFGAREMAELMQEDARGAILAVMEALQGLDDVDRGSVMRELFGEESVAAIAPMVSNLDNLRQAFGLVADETKFAGSMTEEFETRMETTGAQLKLTGGQLDRMAVNFGTVLLPAVNDALSAFGDFANVVAGLSTDYPVLTEAIVYGVSALIAYKVAKFGARFALEAIKAPLLDARVLYRRAGLAAATSGDQVGGFSRRTRAAARAVRGFKVGGMMTALANLGGAAKGFTLSGITAAFGSVVRRSNPLRLALTAGRWGFRAVGSAAAAAGRRVGGFTRRTNMAGLAASGFKAGGAVSAFRNLGSAARGVSLGGIVRGFSSLVRFAGPLKSIFSIARWGFRAIRIAASFTPVGLILNGLIVAAELIISNWDTVWRHVKPVVEWVSDKLSVIGRWFSDDEEEEGGERPAATGRAATRHRTRSRAKVGEEALKGTAAPTGPVPSGPVIPPPPAAPERGQPAPVDLHDVEGGVRFSEPEEAGPDPFGDGPPVDLPEYPGPGPVTATTTNNITVNITAPAGTSPEEIARLVIERLTGAAGAAGGELYDHG